MNKNYALYREKMFKDVLYGSGSREYLLDLIKDFVIDHDMYGHKQVTFTIKKTKFCDSSSEEV